VSPIEAAVVLLMGGIVAGIIGSGGGVSSLVSYPALLAVRISPLQANMANLVAGVAIGPGSAVSSQRELAKSRVVLMHLVPFAVLGTVIQGCSHGSYHSWSPAVPCSSRFNLP
jgi:uncharacterized protein